MYMETKGIEEMTRLIELVSSLNKDLESTKKDLELYKDWKNREEAAKVLAEKKMLAIKAFLEVV
jgi:predicted house-cleaning noncanonical NTP pyrophosphatase (MazG superfamily)